jgi:hypothetical protein
VSNEFLLKLHIETLVPLAIEEYRLSGGPSEHDFARIRNVYPTEIGSHGDALLYREKKQTARMVNMLVDGLAVLAFCPGGVTTFGCHFEAMCGVV